MDAATFRQDFPEFSDTTKYPTSSIDTWLMMAGLLLPPDRWEDLLDRGTGLYVAHHLVLAALDQEAAAAGATPGQVKGVQTSKAVDKVSVGYDTAAVTLQDGGFFNMTRYGVQFLQLARMVGAGGIQL
ncbi:DUF4054 domain-containing protein [Pseudomonas sp.]|uniref:DUF4054 domain-containing protein n=1 Tax=Pseudomonas sp. TaxID=306 RepID=UPI00258DF23C|nr:DUF4054 domain-containing protein [Pseudomonas sp.]